MSNLSYWENRKAWEMFHYMEQAEQAANEVSKLYLKGSRYISLELDEIFERYQKKHKLSKVEAKRLLSTMKDKSSIVELKAALKAGSSDKTKAEILAELESPAYQSRLEKLEQLQNQLDMTMTQVYHQEKAQSTSHYVELANEAYYRSVFNTQQRTGLGFEFNQISSQAIDQVINSKWSGKNYSARIWDNTNALAQDLKEELLLNLVTGRTDREVAELITYKFAVGASQARRLVRTESCNLANQMDMASYEECGIDCYIYAATLDLKTSSICRDLDGKKFKVSEQRPGVNCPPMHPWCRSTTICDIDDEELSQMKRRARDPVTGKTNTVPADMTYEQWYKKYVTGKPEAELNEKIVKNRSVDKRQHERYKEILGEDAPKSLDSFQKMKYTDDEKWKKVQAIYRKTNAYNKIMPKEPAITADLKEISNNTGVKLIGLENRVKTKDSFLRKINSDSKHSLDSQVIKDTISSTNDVIRFTYQDSALTLADSYQKIIKQINQKGHKKIRVKNEWLNKRVAYNGINCTFESPQGQKFEIQFHTPESFKLKNGEMHNLYEEFRKDNISTERRNEINNKMFELSSQLEIPMNIDKVK